MLTQQAERRMAGGNGKGGGDHGLFGAGADQPGIGARAQSEAQTVEQDRFAGPGLAGERRQPGAEREVQPLDQHHVADREAVQHRK